MYIETEIDNDVVLKEELHLNTVFDFEELEYYNTISLKELNIILNEFEGVFKIMMNEEYTDFEKVEE